MNARPQTSISIHALHLPLSPPPPSKDRGVFVRSRRPTIHLPLPPSRSSKERGAFVLARRPLHPPPTPTPALLKRAWGVCPRPPAPPPTSHSHPRAPQKSVGRLSSPAGPSTHLPLPPPHSSKERGAFVLA